MQFVSRTLGSMWQCAPILQLLIEVFSAMQLCSPTTHESSIWVDFMSLVGWIGTNWQPPVTDSHRSLIWEIEHLTSLRCPLHEVSWIFISLTTTITSEPFQLDWKFLVHYEMFLSCVNYTVVNDIVMWVFPWTENSWFIRNGSQLHKLCNAEWYGNVSNELGRMSKKWSSSVSEYYEEFAKRSWEIPWNTSWEPISWLRVKLRISWV
jgi:hypothetical protein